MQVKHADATGPAREESSDTSRIDVFMGLLLACGLNQGRHGHFLQFLANCPVNTITV
jgi:hypothetical protein